MLSQTPSKRGRPRGSQNKKPREFPQTPKPYTPKSFNPNKIILSDEQIRINLGRPEGEPSTDKRVGGASRTIFKITGQYPWKWAAGFPPRFWTVDMVGNLRQLVKGFNDKTPGNTRGNNCQEVKDWLRDQARRRDMRAPRLTEDDLQDALKYYNIETKTRAKMSQKITQTGALTSAAEIVDLTYHDDAESDTESSLFIEDDYDERIAADHDQDNKSIIPLMSSNEATLQPQKRSGPPLECSQAHKRARIFDPEDTGGIQLDTIMSEDITVSQEAPVSKDATANDTCLSRFVPDVPYRPRDIADLIDGINHLRSKKEKEKEHITRTLTELRASMRANEACITPSSIVNHVSLDKLRLILKKHKTEREDIQKGKEFFEQHHQDLALGAAFIAKNNRHYETSLRDCDELIKQTQLQIDTELKKAAQRTSGIKAQLESDTAETLRLEVRELKAVQNSEFYRVISSLAKLGPSGLETLLNKFKYDNIPLPSLVEEIQAVSII
ncbi:hypothetical protein ACHAPJ_008203 [Fusarium lateritium]